MHLNYVSLALDHQNIGVNPGKSQDYVYGKREYRGTWQK